MNPGKLQQGAAIKAAVGFLVENAATSADDTAVAKRHSRCDWFASRFFAIVEVLTPAVDTIKIGDPFIRNLRGNQDDSAIGSAMAAMGQSLKLRVSAVGVETEGRRTSPRKGS